MVGVSLEEAKRIRKKTILKIFDIRKYNKLLIVSLIIILFLIMINLITWFYEQGLYYTVTTVIISTIIFVLFSKVFLGLTKRKTKKLLSKIKRDIIRTKDVFDTTLIEMKGLKNISINYLPNFLIIDPRAAFFLGSINTPAVGAISYHYTRKARKLMGSGKSYSFSIVLKNINNTYKNKINEPVGKMRQLLIKTLKKADTRIKNNIGNVRLVNLEAVEKGYVLTIIIDKMFCDRNPDKTFKAIKKFANLVER